MPLVLVALAVGTLLVVPFLGHSSTGLVTSRAYGQTIIEQYSADSGIEHALWRLKYEPGFANSLTLANPTTSYTVGNINGTSVNATITFTFLESPPIPPWTSNLTQSSRVVISKVASDCTGSVSENVTFTYTISITIPEDFTATNHYEEIMDKLPPGFSYVAGSSNVSGNIDTAEPDTPIPIVDGRQQLRWANDHPLPKIKPGQTQTQSFRVSAIMGANVYWNEARATIDVASVGTIATGSTAPIGGGFCPYAYDILASTGGTNILARAAFGATGLSILSWRVR